MRILMISWEYPPHVVGGLGKHVDELLPPLGMYPGVDVHLITPRWSGGIPREHVGNATVHRVEPLPAEGGFLARVSRTNKQLLAYAAQLWLESGPFDLIHVHDWLAAFAGIDLKHAYRTPLICTMHATERGRGRGQVNGDQARAIHQTEWDLTYESWRVIACSDFMASEIVDYFRCPRDKIDVIPNGVDSARFDRLDGQNLSRFRRRFVLPSEQLVFSVGRIVYEKGLHVLVKATPAVLAEQPTARVVVAGRGPELEALRALALRLGLGPEVKLVGFISDEDRDKLFRVADCAVFPSLYEPFGIVALEAMAARCPVVVTDVGGLQDVVEHGVTGVSVSPDDPDALARGILHTLRHAELAAKRAEDAYRAVRQDYDWENIAATTIGVYSRVIAERVITAW